MSHFTNKEILSSVAPWLQSVLRSFKWQEQALMIILPYSLTVTFLSRLLDDPTPSFALVPFSLAASTKALVYLSASFSVDRCDATLAASYLFSDAVTILCRLPLVSSLLTSSRAYPPPGSSILVPLLLHIDYPNPPKINDPGALAVSAL